MNTRRTLAAALAAAAVLTVVLLDAGEPMPAEANQGATNPNRVTTAVGPAPAESTTAAVVQQPPAACDPRASLRPAAPLPVPGQMPADSTMARIAERGRLIAGVDQNTYLFGFRDPDTGRLDGFDIEIVRDIAGAIFDDRERVEFRPVNIVDRIPIVERADVDVVVSTLTISCERRARVEFSGVYLEAGQRVLVNRGTSVTGLDGLGGKRVCAARGSTSLRNILIAPSEPEPVGVPNATDCLVLLQVGEVDAVSTDDTLLAGLAAQDPRTEIVGPRFTEEPYGVAVNREDPDLVRFVNAVLERRVADGTWLASYQRWLTPLGPAPAPPALRYRD